MAPRRKEDPQVTDLRRYRRERERAERAKSRPSEEPLLGANKKGALFVVLAVAVLAALAWLSGHRF